MHLRYRNVNDSFCNLVSQIHSGQIPTRKVPSRVGDVLMIEEPVLVTYSHPRERVLFNEARDANPFFHCFEALWMLAGRNDLEPLTRYVSTFGQFSDDGKTLNGAYGYRWRHGCCANADCEGGVYGHPDQLKAIVNHLKAKPESRRAVLQMWNVEDDLLKVDSSKDVCCNLSVMFSLRTEGVVEKGRDVFPIPFLDMTVTNRSNDMIWGMLGANYVHFSFLQEYMAACLGVEVGVYNQFTNNLHVYTSRWEPEKWLATAPGQFKYPNSRLVSNPETFDREVKEFIDNKDWTRNWSEPFLQEVATPMCWAFELHKRRDYTVALKAIESCVADDWRIASRNWLLRRQKNWEAKGA